MNHNWMPGRLWKARLILDTAAVALMRARAESWSESRPQGGELLSGKLAAALEHVLAAIDELKD